MKTSFSLGLFCFWLCFYVNLPVVTCDSFRASLHSRSTSQENQDTAQGLGLSDLIKQRLVKSSAVINIDGGDGFYYLARGRGGVSLVSDANNQTDPNSDVNTYTRGPEELGLASVDDVSYDGTNGLLFIMDFFSDRVACLNASTLEVLQTPITVLQSVFSGISARNFNLVVSAGTSILTTFRYTTTGEILLDTSRTIDLGIGQPDVTLDPMGKFAYVSTDFQGKTTAERFGISVVDLTSTELSVVDRQSIPESTSELFQFSRSPNFALRSAVFGNFLSISYLNGITIYDTSEPTSLQVLLQVHANELGIFPRDVSIDTDGVVIVAGPLSLDDLNSNAVKIINIETLEVSDTIYLINTDNGVVTGVSSSDTGLFGVATSQGFFSFAIEEVKKQTSTPQEGTTRPLGNSNGAPFLSLSLCTCTNALFITINLLSLIN